MMTNETSKKFFHAYEIVDKRCNGCLDCMRVCPTQAIRIKNNKVKLISELCIDCGECMRVCTQNVFVPLIDDLVDLDQFKYLVAIPSPILYTQFNININPGIIHQALKNIGFNEIVDTHTMSKELSFALYHHIKTNLKNKPLIISYCPTIIRLVQVSYPNLANLISPSDVPREMIARHIKQTYPEKLGLNQDEIAVVYLTPCPSKIVSIKQPAEKERSWIDSALPIKDIYNLILPEIMEIQEKNTGKDLKDFHFTRDWRICEHISWKLGLERSLCVTGLTHAKNIFDDIENSKFRNIELIGALACVKECLNGAFCVENPYVSRQNSILLENKYFTPKIEIDKNKVINEYEKGSYFIERSVLPRSANSDKPDIATSIKRMRQKERIMIKLPQKDCGLCGTPTCDTFAEDCAYGKADLMDCAFFSDKFKK